MEIGRHTIVYSLTVSLVAERVRFSRGLVRHKARIRLLVEATIESECASAGRDARLDVATSVLILTIGAVILCLARDFIEQLLTTHEDGLLLDLRQQFLLVLFLGKYLLLFLFFLYVVHVDEVVFVKVVVGGVGRAAS